MPDDPRVKYWLEADSNIRRANGLSLEDPEWWATILAAIANGIMATAPAELAADIAARKQDTQRRVQKATRRQLKAKQ